MNNHFSNNLKTLRNQYKISQKELADKLNVSYKTISHWENGYTEPNLDILINLKNFFNVSYEELIE